MFRFVLLLWMPLFSISYDHDHPAEEFVCRVAVESNPDVQDECAKHFDLVRECVDEGYDLQKIDEVIQFREEVMCDFFENSGEFDRLVEEKSASFSYDALKDSVRIKQRLEQDIKIKIAELAEQETREEVEAITQEADRKTREVEEWLEENEQSYLRKLSNMMRELLGRDLLSTPAPFVQPTSTYLTDVRARTEFSLGFLYTSPTSAMSPSEKMVPIDRTFVCFLSVLPMAMSYFPNVPTVQSVKGDEMRLAVERHPHWFSVTTEKIDVLANTDFVLAIMFLPCEGGSWTYVSYHGVRFTTNDKGWLIMSYAYVNQNDPTIVDPFAAGEDGELNDQLVVFSAFGSKAKPKNCVNEVAGPGIYRVLEDGTCRGLPLFSLRAAEVEEDCTGMLWEGVQIKSLYMLVIEEFKFEECKSMGDPLAPATTRPDRSNIVHSYAAKEDYNKQSMERTKDDFMPDAA